MVSKCKRSKCCNARVRNIGAPDFLRDKTSCTFHYSCTLCNKACDIKEVLIKSYKATSLKKKRKGRAKLRLVSSKPSEKQEKILIGKQIVYFEARLDLQAKILNKLVEFVTGLKIDSVKGIVISVAKLHQLNELQKMEQDLFIMEVNKPQK